MHSTYWPTQGSSWQFHTDRDDEKFSLIWCRGCIQPGDHIPPSPLPTIWSSKVFLVHPQTLPQSLTTQFPLASYFWDHIPRNDPYPRRKPSILYVPYLRGSSDQVRILRLVAFVGMTLANALGGNQRWQHQSLNHQFLQPFTSLLSLSAFCSQSNRHTTRREICHQHHFYIFWKHARFVCFSLPLSTIGA